MAIREMVGETGVYGGDIGCSSLPPHASDWLTCMGSGIGIAQGVAMVTDQKVIASIGDSTFFHAGLPGVLNAQQQGANLVLVVLDNQYVAMTGHQPTANTDEPHGGPPGGGQTVTIESALAGLGVTDVRRVDAYDYKQMRFELAQALGRKGLSVLVVAGECRLQLGRREPEKIEALPRYALIPELCNRCGACYEQLGCVAIHDLGEELRIDPDACTRCGLCYQVCTDRKAIIPYTLEPKE
jgi:indolepyruvate ferredoxin oxidoreductase alpha subunit